MRITGSRVRFTNVVHHLRGLPQRLVASGAEGRVYRTAPIRSARAISLLVYPARNTRSLHSALSSASGRESSGRDDNLVRIQPLWNCSRSAAPQHAKTRLAGGPGPVEMTRPESRRGCGAPRFAAAFISLTLLCATFLPSPLLAEDVPRIGIGVPPVPTGHIPTEPRPVIQSAGFAFAGTVKAVEHIAAVGRNRIGTTRITFHVDTPIRGVRAGQTLVISEWAALWSSGERYRPGERVCLFLYPLSKLGLTSPVRGPAGRFRVRGPGRIVVPPGQRPILPPPVRTRLDENGEITVEDFARALQERRAP